MFIDETSHLELGGPLKIKYTDHRFNKNTKVLLESIIEIVENYQRQGYRMTLRQLYYQLVSKNIIANKENEYDKLSRVLTDARMTGLVDWDFIEDRVRIARRPNQYENVRDLVDAALRSYRRDRWTDQPNYVEVWVEKDALSGVLLPITRDYHIHLLVNRGYSSATAVHDSALRYKEASANGKKCYLIYLGDHDPSGQDMARDIGHRLSEFGCRIELRHIALTMAQITDYNLPPNPAKMSDSRANKYVSQHGRQSWELDALPPDSLNGLLKVSLDQIIDKEKYDAVKELEEQDKKWLQEMADEHVRGD